MRKSNKPKIILAASILILAAIFPVVSYEKGDVLGFLLNLPIFVDDKISCGTLPTADIGVRPDNSNVALANRSLIEANKNLLEENKKWDRAPFFWKNKWALKNALENRKKSLTDAIHVTPNIAYQSLLDKDTRAKLLKISKNCVEDSVEINGGLEIFHTDFFEENKSSNDYNLVANNGQKIKIYPAIGLKDFLESRTKVRINGFKIDNEMIFDGTKLPAHEQSGIEVLSQPGNPPVLGEQKTLVILTNFQNTQQPSLKPEDVKKMVFTDADSVNQFYKENSYGKISLSGDVVGWYTIKSNQNCFGDSFNSINKTMEAADHNVDFRKYSRIIIVAPLDKCSSGTLGKIYLNTPDGVVEASLAFVNVFSPFFSRITEHELGHGFGLSHSKSMICGDAIFPDGDICKVYEYGDSFYDVMGSGRWHLNAIHKEELGWLDSMNIKTVLSDGTFIVQPIEHSSNGVNALKIPRDDPLMPYTYIEYRQAFGIDKTIAEEYPSFDIYGTLIHLFSSSHTSFLLDASPSNNYAYILGEGQEIIDKKSSTKIKVNSANSNMLSVMVDLPCDKKIFYRDYDYDGFGDPNAITRIACQIPAGYAENNLDCDDNKEDVNPSSSEKCNSKDDNCNGSIDENLSSHDGSDYFGPGKSYADVAGAKSKVKGACQYALVSCISGKWQWDYKAGAARYGWTYENNEGSTNTNNCNDGVDNDCDGFLDCGTLQSCSPLTWASDGERSNGHCNSFCDSLAQQICGQVGGSQGQGQGAAGGGGYQAG